MRELDKILGTVSIGPQWKSRYKEIKAVSARHQVDLNSVEVIRDYMVLVGEPKTGKAFLLVDGSIVLLTTVYGLLQGHKTKDGEKMVKVYLADISETGVLPSRELNAQFIYHAYDVEYGLYRGRLPTIQANQVDHTSNLQIFLNREDAVS